MTYDGQQKALMHGPTFLNVLHKVLPIVDMVAQALIPAYFDIDYSNDKVADKFKKSTSGCCTPGTIHMAMGCILPEPPYNDIGSKVFPPSEWKRLLKTCVQSCSGRTKNKELQIGYPLDQTCKQICTKKNEVTLAERLVTASPRDTQKNKHGVDKAFPPPAQKCMEYENEIGCKTLPLFKIGAGWTALLKGHKVVWNPTSCPKQPERSLGEALVAGWPRRRKKPAPPEGVKGTGEVCRKNKECKSGECDGNGGGFKDGKCTRPAPPKYSLKLGQVCRNNHDCTSKHCFGNLGGTTNGKCDKTKRTDKVKKKTKAVVKSAAKSALRILEKLVYGAEKGITRGMCKPLLDFLFDYGLFQKPMGSVVNKLFEPAVWTGPKVGKCKSQLLVWILLKLKINPCTYQCATKTMVMPVLDTKYYHAVQFDWGLGSESPELSAQLGANTIQGKPKPLHVKEEWMLYHDPFWPIVPAHGAHSVIERSARLEKTEKKFERIRPLIEALEAKYGKMCKQGDKNTLTPAQCDQWHVGHPRIHAACGSKTTESPPAVGSVQSVYPGISLGTPLPKFLNRSGTLGIVECHPNREGVGTARWHAQQNEPGSGSKPLRVPYCFGFGPECTPVHPVYPTTVPKSQSWAKSYVTSFLIQKRVRNPMKILEGQFEKNNGTTTQEAPQQSIVCQMAMSYQFTYCMTCCCAGGLAKVYLDTALAPLGIQAKAIQWIGEGMTKADSVYHPEDVFQCKQWFTFLDTFIRAVANLMRTGETAGRLIYPGAPFSSKCIEEAEQVPDGFPSCVPVLPRTLNARKCGTCVSYFTSRWGPSQDTFRRVAYCSKLLTLFKKEFGRPGVSNCCMNKMPREEKIREFLGRHATQSGCPPSHVSDGTLKLNTAAEAACQYCSKAKGQCCWNPQWCDRKKYNAPADPCSNSAGPGGMGFLPIH